MTLLLLIFAICVGLYALLWLLTKGIIWHAVRCCRCAAHLKQAIDDVHEPGVLDRLASSHEPKIREQIVHRHRGVCQPHHTHLHHVEE